MKKSPVENLGWGQLKMLVVLNHSPNLLFCTDNEGTEVLAEGVAGAIGATSLR